MQIVGTQITIDRRKAVKIAAGCVTVAIAIAGAWWLLSGQLPPLSDDEWPYIGAGDRQGKLADALIHALPIPHPDSVDAAA